MRKLLRELAHDPKTDELWKTLIREMHPDAHKAMAIHSIIAMTPEASLIENRKNLALAVRHIVSYWIKLYGVESSEA